MWSTQYDSSKASAVHVYDVGAGTNYFTKTDGDGVRCIVPKAATGACTVSECGCGRGAYTSGDSCILCESGYYCTDGNSRTKCPSDKYSKPGATASSECFSCPTNCAACSDSNTCTQCKDGYELTSDGKCEKTCPYSWQMLINISGTDYCFTKFNVGDFVNGIGVDIPSSAGVTTVSAKQSCGSTSQYAKCCWRGSSKTASICDAANGSYSGCYRTACTWPAADAICSALNMQLPTTAQLETIYSTYSRSLGNNGAQLCDYNSGKGSSRCFDGSGNCVGYDNDSNCYPNYVWSTQYGYAKAYVMFVYNGTTTSNYGTKYGQFSVRCIKAL